MTIIQGGWVAPLTCATVDRKMENFFKHAATFIFILDLFSLYNTTGIWQVVSVNSSEAAGLPKRAAIWWSMVR